MDAAIQNAYFYIKLFIMKGLSFIKDKKNKKIAVQIDLKTLRSYEEKLEDLYDVIIAESRVEEASVPFEKVVKKLKKKGKL
jgi:hypothetical protein